MDKPTALQHIYTRVAEAQSPQRVEGFQTLFLTTGQLKREVALQILEPRLFYNSMVEYKRVFFCLEGDSSPAVVAKLVRLDDSDQHGRRGLYLAHTLILKSDSFVRVGGNPYALYDSFKFAVSLEDALRLGDPKSGDIPSVVLDPLKAWIDDSVEAAAEWPAPEIRRLAFLALNARDLKTNGQPVAIVGPPDAIDEVLRIACLLLPSELLRHCSFDTCCLDNTGSQARVTKFASPENNRPRVIFWALGFPKEPPDRGSFVVVDARHRKVCNETIRWNPVSLYELWLDTQMREGRWHEILAHKDRAYGVGTSVDGAIEQLVKPAPSPGSILRTVVKKVASVVADWGEGKQGPGGEEDK